MRWKKMKDLFKFLWETTLILLMMPFFMIGLFLVLCASIILGVIDLCKSWDLS